MLLKSHNLILCLNPFFPQIVNFSIKEKQLKNDILRIYIKKDHSMSLCRGDTKLDGFKIV